MKIKNDLIMYILLFFIYFIASSIGCYISYKTNWYHFSNMSLLVGVVATWTIVILFSIREF